MKSNLNSEERNIIKDIKDNPKSFFSYVKSKSKSKSLISLLIDKRNNIVTDPKKMADLFQDFFTSVFSDPGVPDKKMPDFTKPNIVKPLEPLTYNLQDIETAIDDIKESAGCPEHEISAKVLNDNSHFGSFWTHLGPFRPILSFSIKIVADFSMIKLDWQSLFL